VAVHPDAAVCHNCILESHGTSNNVGSLLYPNNVGSLLYPNNVWSDVPEQRWVSVVT
jgi:hypothetical protein